MRKFHPLIVRCLTIQILLIICFVVLLTMANLLSFEFIMLFGVAFLFLLILSIVGLIATLRNKEVYKGIWLAIITIILGLILLSYSAMFMVPSCCTTPLHPQNQRELNTGEIQREKEVNINLDKDKANMPYPPGPPDEVIGMYGGRTIKRSYVCFGDVCPDNGGWYLLYEGNYSKEECIKIGGEPIVGYGWGEVYAGCGVK